MNRRRFLHAAALMAASTPLLTIAGGRVIAAAARSTSRRSCTTSDADGGKSRRRRRDRRLHGLQLPFCKKSSPDLERFVDDDGKVRLVYKDWPILTDASVIGAHLALAAKYQGKYREAHVAMMSIRGRRSTTRACAKR